MSKTLHFSFFIVNHFKKICACLHVFHAFTIVNLLTSATTQLFAACFGFSWFYQVWYQRWSETSLWHYRHHWTSSSFLVLDVALPDCILSSASAFTLSFATVILTWIMLYSLLSKLSNHILHFDTKCNLLVSVGNPIILN